MKYNFIVSDLDNLFFFIVNLTEWHFSCRSKYNQIWLKQGGKLTPREKKLLIQLKKISQKYNFETRKYLGRYVYCCQEQNKFDKLAKVLTPEEFDIITECLEVFQKRFSKVYNRKLLEKWSKALKSEVVDKNFCQLEKITHNFFNPSKSQKTLNVHLLFSPSTTSLVAGGANLGSEDITLEVPIFRLEDWLVEYATKVLLHELTHIWFNDSKQYQIARKLTKSHLPTKINDFPSFLIIKEVLIGSWVPSGYPSQIYSNKLNPIKEFLLHNLRGSSELYQLNRRIEYNKLLLYLIWSVYPLTVDYFHLGKRLDTYYLRQLINKIKK